MGGSWWVWFRENYAGDGREHLHMVMHLPPRLRADLQTAIRRWYPGAPDLVQIGERKAFYNPATGRRTDGLSYRMKQMRGDAVGPPGPTRLYRETKSRHDGAPVAPVHGKRCGVSSSLSLKAEEAWQNMKKGDGFQGRGAGRTWMSAPPAKTFPRLLSSSTPKAEAAWQAARRTPNGSQREGP